jgi:uncharacterized protein YfaS (alpha-2-macroglobulin family)
MKLGETFTEDAGFFTIEPRLAGVYRWYGARLLAFEPADFLPQQTYTVTVTDALKSLGGKPLSGEKTFTFETERLSVLGWNLGDGTAWVNQNDAEPELSRTIRVVFSYSVDLDEIAKWIEIQGAGKTFGFTLSYNKTEASYYQNQVRHETLEGGRAVLITMNEKPPPNTQMTVSLKEGARSKPGWLGAKQESVFSFHTLKPFELTRTSVSAYTMPRSWAQKAIQIQLYFSHSVEEKGAEKYFTIEGFPPLKNVDVYGSTVLLSDLPLEYESRYVITVSADLKDTLGRKLGVESKNTIHTETANSYVSIYDSGFHTMEAAYPPRYPWEVLNPQSIAKFIGKVDGLYSPFVEFTLQKTEINTQEIPRNKKFFFMEEFAPYLGPSGKGTTRLKWVYSEEDWNGRQVERERHLTVQVTDIGITARYAYNSVIVWATRLSTGAPVPDADVTLFNNERRVLSGKTDAQGLAVFDLQDGEFVKKFPLLQAYDDYRYYNRPEQLRIKVVEKGGAANGGDEAEFIPNNSHNLWRFNIAMLAEPRTVEIARPVIFLFTDRGLYRPGDTVSFRGVDRMLALGKFQAYTGSYTVEMKADYSGDKPPVVLKGLTTASGGSYGSFVVPTDAAPGTYTIRYTRGGAEETITFTVANFQPLRFEASLSAPSTPFYQGDSLSMRFTASYLAGGALADAPYTYHWTRENLWFHPRKEGVVQWEKWRFGPENSDNRTYIGGGEGVLGSDGTASIIQQTVGDVVKGSTYTYNLEVSAQDAARQEVASRASVTVHPAAFYIGARVDGNSRGRIKNPSDVDDSAYSAWFLPVNEPAVLSWVMVDPDGSLSKQTGPLTVQFIRYEWKQALQAGVGGRVNASWERVEEVVREQTIDTSKASRGIVTFTPNRGGEWATRIQGVDAKGRTALTSVVFYVSGGDWVRWGAADVNAIQLMPDKPVYAIGDTARLMARSPLPKGKYLLTIEREGFFKKDSGKIIEMDGSSCIIDVPIEEGYAPIVYVALSSYSVRTGTPKNTYYNLDLGKPHGVFGLVSLRVDVEMRRYEIAIESQKDVFAPGETAEVRLKVTNKGKPVPGAEIAFLAVDRGILDLIDYHVPDPLEFFYAPGNFPHAVRGGDSRSLLLDPVTYSLTDLQGGDTRFGAEDGGKMGERSDWTPTAVFEPFLVADANGVATATFKLPDSLTTYRCTAVAFGEQHFGVAEDEFRVTAPLTATAALPRKLRWRDTGTVSLILTNLENKQVDAQVSLETENVENPEGETAPLVLEVDGESSKTVKIPAGATREVQFKVSAVSSGEAKLTWTLHSPSVNERIIKLISIDRPSVYETVASIGTLSARDKNFVEEGVVLPSLVPEGTGSLSVTLAASRLAQLKEAVGYLLNYPYGCLEQRTAALAPLVAFGEYLENFQLDSPVKDHKETIEKELAFIVESQLDDGTYPYWSGGDRGDALVSLRVAHIALMAKEKGYSVPDKINVRKTLNTIPLLIRNYKDPFIHGYWYYVNALADGKSASANMPTLQEFLKRGDEIGISGYAFAGLAASALGDKETALQTLDYVKRFLRPGTRTVDLLDTAEQTAYWGGVSTRYALALMLFYTLEPTSDTTTRLTQSLLDRQRRGVWEETASSFWAILSFGLIAEHESKTRISVQGSVTLDKKSFLTAEWKSYGGLPITASATFAEPFLLDTRRDSLLPLRIERKGSGDLYYTASLRYGIPAELAQARDEGIGVFVETLDKNGDVAQGVFIQGETYTRRVIVSSSRDRTFLAVRAPIPSGCEIVDATFVTSSTTPLEEDEEDVWWNLSRGFQRFIMDDEVRFHWDYFDAGKEEASFRFRAIMPGVYPTPPAQAECMYEPEVFGRSAGELARIL